MLVSFGDNYQKISKCDLNYLYHSHHMRTVPVSILLIYTVNNSAINDFFVSEVSKTWQGKYDAQEFFRYCLDLAALRSVLGVNQVNEYQKLILQPTKWIHSTSISKFGSCIFGSQGATNPRILSPDEQIFIFQRTSMRVTLPFYLASES